jgi:hypothetical protein
LARWKFEPFGLPVDKESLWSNDVQGTIETLVEGLQFRSITTLGFDGSQGWLVRDTIKAVIEGVLSPGEDRNDLDTVLLPVTTTPASLVGSHELFNTWGIEPDGEVWFDDLIPLGIPEAVEHSLGVGITALETVVVDEEAYRLPGCFAGREFPCAEDFQLCGNPVSQHVREEIREPPLVCGREPGSSYSVGGAVSHEYSTTRSLMSKPSGIFP